MNYKNTLILITLILLLCTGLLHAQQGNGKERIESLKVAFITKRIDLTSKEAQQFWPLYNEYQQKREDLKIVQRQNRKNLKDSYEGMPDKEIEAMIDDDILLKQKDLDLQKELHKKLKLILSSKKIALLYKAEDDFKRELLKQLKEK
ncbi:MAG: hypothetical protein J0M08_07510 [Bacteroidetes bacterium]|nr:hypothetical protein [Bacteroidota bacterium]